MFAWLKKLFAPRPTAAPWVMLESWPSPNSCFNSLVFKLRDPDGVERYFVGSRIAILPSNPLGRVDFSHGVDVPAEVDQLCCIELNWKSQGEHHV